ncbi:MAG: helix-turn-helix domain-containing protein [Treponemataceae bacterium]|nr:helix-turn-helix domain-containing protein [Treponemataceae bacterium]
MEYTYSLESNKKVVDIPATARLLKQLRLEHGYSVAQLQNMLGLESTVAIYAWESEKIKNIPSIENFDFLAKLYGLHVENLYVLKTVTDYGEMEVHEFAPDYDVAFFMLV